MHRRNAIIPTLKAHLAKAQHGMKVLADKRRSERSFAIGDWVWLRLPPYRQSSVQVRMNQKLAHKYFDPFRVEDIVGTITYRLTFPPSVKILNVFHVSQLKPFRGVLPTSPHIPSWLHGTVID